MDFVHLHVHTEYSLLDGASRISELIARVKELGMNAVAMTDHGAMYGAVEFYREAKKAGIKPIIGCEMYVAQDMGDKSYASKEYAHLILLCKNQEGYRNLIKLVSLAYIDGFYYKPRIDYELLSRYAGGLICSSACLAGDIPRMVLDGDYDGAKRLACRLNGMFNGDFYLELQDNGVPEEKTVNSALIKMAGETGIKLVATNDAHYINREDALPQDVLMCIQTARYLDEEDRMKFLTDEFYIKSPDEMSALFASVPEAIENTVKIAEMCNVDFDFSAHHLPVFDVPGGEGHGDYLRAQCEKGLARRYSEITGELRARLDYELGVISSMGFTDYFLIVWDFVAYAKSQGIAVGPGRGSAAGSLCAYALGITDIDPIEYNLLFERFLNPERISMPDIDIDFCMERREEVIAYVVNKYGAERVAQIITFGTLGAKQVIRDVARVLRVSVAEADRISKMVPFALKMTIDRAINENPKLKAEYESNDQVRRIIDIAKKLEGLPRHSSVHAAGVVIANKPVYEYVPLTVNPKDDSVVTQYPMGDIEQLGLLKMDFLGLRNLTVIQRAIRMIKENHGVVIDLAAIKFDDPKVYALISAGDTDGVFQIESPGMRSLMTQMKPSCLSDIMVGIALFRPGPMDSIPSYIATKRNPETVKYLHPRLEPILRETYGAIVYQEQVMEIVRDLGGYSLGRSDLVRRAMAKKKASVMAAERDVFINGEVVDGKVTVDGAVRRGVSREVATVIFDQMTDFAEYAFNKSHACAYAAIVYYTAYLKCYYPLEFLTSLINCYLGYSDKVASYMQYVKKTGVKILPPDINKSSTLFSVEEGAIRFGLSAIRDVGERGVEAIIAERGNGPYKSFADFVRRSCEFLNKRMLEGLILSGSFDSFGFRRSQLMAIYEKALDQANAERKKVASGQVSLFDIGVEPGVSFEITPPDMPEFAKRHMLTMEKRAVGAYLSGHPLDDIAGELNGSDINIRRILEAKDSDAERIYFDGRQVELTGVLTEVKKRLTRQKKMMARAKLEDLYGIIDVIIFPQTFQKCEDALNDDTIVRARGKVDINEGEEAQIIIDNISPYKKGDPYSGKTLFVKIPKEDGDGVNGLKDAIAPFKGDSEFVVKFESTGKKLRAGGQMRVRLCDSLLSALRTRYGELNIILK